MNNQIQFNYQQYYDVTKPQETQNYIMQQSMIRVKDPQASLDFYCKKLGFNFLYGSDFPQWGFSVYFVAYCDKSKIPTDKDERFNFCMNTPGCVEITWNHGTEKQEGRVYNTGNNDGTGTSDGQKVKGGFGHIGITVPDVYEACERLKNLGVEFHKSPNQGGMKGLAFVKDPDGYLIEILPQGKFVRKDIDCLGVELNSGQGYKDNSK